MQLSQRASLLKPSPTLAMANRARELQAAGIDVVSLAVGEPDWTTFPEAVTAAKEALDAGFTRYTAANGIMELRQAIAEQTTKELGISYAATDVAVAAGAKYALFAALQVLVNPGEKVLVPVPYWVSYPVMIELAGGVAVEVPSSIETNFKMSAAALEQAIKTGGNVRVLMLCSPNNPTGIAYSAAELKEIAEVLKKYPEVIVLSDDIYNRLIFPGAKAAAKSAGGLPMAAHLLQVAPELKDRVIVANSVSKSCAMTGWRVGWTLGPKNFTAAISDYLSQSTSNVCSIAQKASLRAIQVQDQKLPEVNRMLDQRRILFSEGLAQARGARVFQPDGAFYIWLGVDQWFGKKHPKFPKKLENSKIVSEALLEAAHLAVVPGAEFGMEGYLRLSLAASEKNLTKAVERMRSFADALE